MRSKQETLDLFPRLQMQTDKQDAKRTLNQAYESAKNSNDPNTKVGAIMFANFGTYIKEFRSCNKIIGKEHDATRAEYPKKSEYAAHAERRVISHIAKEGYTAGGNVLYAPWFACTGCAIAIGEAGIAAVIGHLTMFQHTPQRWVEDMQRAHAMLDDDYGIELFAYDAVVGNTVFFNGKEIQV